MPYQRKRASRHSCTLSSVPFTMDNCTISHAPVFVTRHSRCAPWTGAPAKVFARAPLPEGRTTSVPPSFHIGGRLNGPPSGTSPGPWALRRGVLWWHKTPSSSQGMSLLDQGGKVPPVSKLGVWLLFLVFFLPGPGRGQIWRFPAVPVPPVRGNLWCWRWLAARIHIPIGVTSVVLRK